MTPRERWLACLNHQVPDRVPVDYRATPETTRKVLDHLGVSTSAEMFARLHIDPVIDVAPRYVGRFEKGVDYIGDLAEFERSFAGHAAIARALGPYKLSLHSGSDKFSVYGITAKHTHGLVHLKTAGTSYLEALRATARFDPALFREILAFAIEHYERDKATYHVSASLDNVPAPDTLADADLPGLLDQFDARQVLHVTYGSVLNESRFKERFLAGLAAHEEEHYAALEAHFIKHLTPFKTT